MLEALAREAAAAYPGARVEVAIEEQYRNMKEVLDRHPEVVDHAREAIRRAGLEPRSQSDSRRHRRLAAVVHGAADAEHVRRRAQLPLAARMGVGAGHGKGGRGDRESLPGLGRARREFGEARARSSLGRFSCADPSALPPIARSTVASRTVDAFIAHRPAASWSIGSAHLELVVGFDSARSVLTMQRCRTRHRQGVEHRAACRRQADARRRAHRARLPMDRRTLRAAQPPGRPTTASQLDVHVRASRPACCGSTRVYACYPGSPTIETWTRVVSPGRQRSSVSDLVGWQMTDAARTRAVARRPARRRGRRVRIGRLSAGRPGTSTG